MRFTTGYTANMKSSAAKKKTNDSTPGELRILKAMSKFADHVEGQFSDVRKEMREGFMGVRAEIKKEADRLDRKIENVRGDMVGLLRKEDKKLLHVAGVLNEKEIFDDGELRSVYEMEPFPEPALAKK